MKKIEKYIVLYNKKYMTHPVNKLYFVENLVEYGGDYCVFSTREAAELYINNYIQIIIKKYDKNIQSLIKKDILKILNHRTSILVLRNLIDLQYLNQNKIPWDYIKKIYKLSDRFVEEFNEYLNKIDTLYFVENIDVFCDHYRVFDNYEYAKQYIKDNIKIGLVDYNRGIKVLELKYQKDIENLLHEEIPWEYIEINYNLSDRFLKEFEEYI